MAEDEWGVARRSPTKRGGGRCSARAGKRRTPAEQGRALNAAQERDMKGQRIRGITPGRTGDRRYRSMGPDIRELLGPRQQPARPSGSARPGRRGGPKGRQLTPRPTAGGPTRPLSRDIEDRRPKGERRATAKRREQATHGGWIPPTYTSRQETEMAADARRWGSKRRNTREEPMTPSSKPGSRRRGVQSSPKVAKPAPKKLGVPSGKKKAGQRRVLPDVADRYSYRGTTYARKKDADRAAGNPGPKKRPRRTT